MTLDVLKRFVRPIYYWSPRTCVVCGRHARTVHRETIWQELAAEWDLTSEQFALVDLREGTHCALCRSNLRIRHLAQTFIDDLASSCNVRCRSVAHLGDLHGLAMLKIAEINAVTGIHSFIAEMPGLSYSEYESDDPSVPHEDLLALSYADESFDYVLTSDTLEHVPDFDRALSEIRRVLKIGGKHIFSIPVIWDRRTRVRAEILSGTVYHILPASYHASPQPNREDYLVFNEFGGDVVQRIESAGFGVKVIKAADNPFVATFVAERTGA